MNEVLPYTRNGNGSPALVLMHFFAGSQHEWEGIVALLSPLYECITIDLPGFGDAAGISGYSVAEMMNNVERTVAALALNDFILVGHSMSGKVAVVLAAQGMSGLRALILVTPSPPGPEPIDDGNRKKMLGFDRSRKDATTYLDGITARPLQGHIRESAIDDFIRCPQAAWEAWLSLGSKEDWAEAVGVTDCLTLVITGETDPSLSASVQTKLTLPHLSNAHMEDMRACGHLPMLEKPEELASIISAFVSRASEDTKQFASTEHPDG